MTRALLIIVIMHRHDKYNYQILCLCIIRIILKDHVHRPLSVSQTIWCHEMSRALICSRSLNQSFFFPGSQLRPHYSCTQTSRCSSLIVSCQQYLLTEKLLVTCVTFLFILNKTLRCTMASVVYLWGGKYDLIVSDAQR